MSSEAKTNGPRPHPHPGFFVVLDGPDGGGKTTQAARLADWLRDQGLDVVTCRDPGGTALGERLRGILLDRDTVALSLRSEMLLYMASRSQMVEEIIHPALEAGRVVVCDRFLLANLIYQGYAGGLPVEQIAVVGDVATGRLRPDLTLILDVDLDVARARVGAARDRIEDRPGDYQARVIQGYRESAIGTGRRSALSLCYRAPIVLIDASADREIVFERIKSEVSHVLALDPRP
jgi:dTMP kinase